MSLLSESQAGRLRAGALSAIWRSHRETFDISPMASNPRYKGPPEEDFVALLIVHGLPHLMRAWRPFFKKWQIQFSLAGVFCHQTPKAEFSLGSRMTAPELADLLLVRRHTDKHGQVRQVASLLQAKMSDDGDVSLPNGDPQLHLLTHWPSFRVKGKNAPKKSFAVGRAERQAVYAAISRKPDYPENNVVWPDSCAWGTLLPSQCGSVEKSLATFLIDMLNFTEGREFYEQGNTACDWSELIHYLLNETFELPLRTRDIRFPEPRGITFSLNRTVFAAKEGWFKQSFLPTAITRLANSAGEDEPPQNREEIDYGEGGQGRVIILETSEAQG